MGRGATGWCVGQPSAPKSPLVRLAADLKAANAERTTWCESTRNSARRSFPKERRPKDGQMLGYEAMALDVWCVREFADRNRSRGWSWVPFYTGELDATPDTDETIAARIARTYPLGGSEKSEHADMVADPVGTIAATEGTLAAHRRGHPGRAARAAPQAPAESARPAAAGRAAQ